MITTPLDASLLKFSQETIVDIYKTEDSVEEWHDRPPYTAPVLVLQWEDSSYTCYDNKRLYSARKLDKTLECLVYGEAQRLPDEMLNQDRVTDIIIWWSGPSPKNVEPCMGMYYFKGQVLTAGLLVGFRCAHQSSVFSIKGSFEPAAPYSKGNAPKAEGTLNLKRPKRKKTDLDEKIALPLLFEHRSNSGDVYIAQYIDQPVLQRNDLADYLYTHQDFINAREFIFYPDWKLKAPGEEADDIYHDDELEEIYEQLELDMEEEWIGIEIELARNKVYPLPNPKKKTAIELCVRIENSHKYLQQNGYTRSNVYCNLLSNT